MVGEDDDMAKEARVLNRIVRWHPLSPSQPTDLRLRKCLTPQPMLCPGCLSTTMISICWPDDLLREPPLEFFNHVEGLAQVLRFVAVSVGTPQDRACVALAVSFTRSPRHPKLLFSSSSADTCPSVARRQRSLWNLVLSWASSAFRFRSIVFVPASAKSSHATTRRARKLVRSRTIVSRLSRQSFTSSRQRAWYC